ncbi:wall-associated receptor kinase-like 8 [Silene latifolia]|uniref:wall-associated receptor kinase-like 8 n=1 Tax=Silene latifolia TaxID=37657 RepID=UPI003D77A3CE
MSYYHIILALILLLPNDVEATLRIAKQGCNDTCGNVSIPYPFGIGPKCYHNPWFDVECTNSNKFKLKALQGSYVHPQGRQINWVGERTLTMESECQGYCGDFDNNSTGLRPIHSTDLRNSPFLYSGNRNILLVAGCGGGVVLKNSREEALTGCAQICRNESEQFKVKHCYGVGCCQTTLPYSLDYFWLDFMVNPSKICRPTAAIVVDKSWISNKVIGPRLSQLDYCPVPVILEWNIVDLPVHSLSYSNSSCVYKKSSSGGGEGGYVCQCKADYYEGNPYLPYGCQVVRECERCVQDCLSYEDGTFGCLEDVNQEFEEVGILKEKAGLILGLGIGISIILLLSLFGAYWIHKVMKKRKETGLKAIYFKRNGGMVLKQLLSSEENANEKARIFTSSELEKATDQYNRNRILGHGGQGTVYKGMLCDGKIVAIKKFKLLDEGQLNDFINEVKLLSQINHRNIVQLLGCCLETEIPLLVYEYVPNGTLSEHIVSPNNDFPCTWEMRSQIALDIANALAYLHSSSLLPIFHRDIKANNILLDSKYRAKLSDFGISKSIAIDQTHVTTRVVGTFGYLDPEYFQSRQFTDKSDVYSFGVVLVELLTGQMADRSTKDDRGLVPWFMSHVQTNTLYDILDARVAREGEKEKVGAIAELAIRCLILDGRKRPSMKDVEATLQTIRSSQEGALNHLSAIIIMNSDARTSKTDDNAFRRLRRNGTY